MSDEDKNPKLSKEDAALWQKIKESLDKPGPPKDKPSSQPKKAQSQTKDSPAAPPTTADFAKMLDEEQHPKPHNKPSETPTLSTPRPKSKPTKTPAPLKVERFNPQDARNLAAGKQDIEGIIDLHGHRQTEAEQALRTFVKRAQRDGKRFILVITGKGQHKDDHDRPFDINAREIGVLRRKVPHWLEDMPDAVVSYKTAHKNHGGIGALYVRLRRLK